jgi:predicted PurR-regulated permease PerM
MGALALTVVQVYVFHPAIEFLLPYVKRRSVAIVVLSVLFLVPFFIISIYLITTIANQLIVISQVPEVKEIIDLTGSEVSNFLSGLSTGSLNFGTVTQSFGALVDVATRLGGIFFQIFLASLLTAYVLYKEHTIHHIVGSIENEHIKDFIHFVDEGLKQLIYSMILTAAVTGLIATILYALFGVPFAVLLGLLTGIVALIPILGAWLVYAPVSIYIFSQGNIILGLIFLGLSVGLVSTLPDLVVRPILICRCEHIDMMLLMLGFVMGAFAFGAVGTILGPLLVIILIGFTRIFLPEVTRAQKCDCH